MKNIKIMCTNALLEFLSRILPIKYLRKIIIDRNSVIIERVLIHKYIRVLYKNKNSFKGIEKNSKYIEFIKNYNKFTVFNMCYISDMLGKALFAVAMGCIPKFSVLDEEGENYFNTFFKPITDYTDLLLCDIDIPRIQYNTGNIHWNMGKKEEYVYSLLYKKFFVLKDDINEKFDRENDKFLKGFEYFRRVFCLAKCDCYVGERTEQRVLAEL